MVTAPYSSKYVLKNFYNLVEDVSEIRKSTRMISLANFDGGHPKSEKILYEIKAWTKGNLVFV